ncbi:MAG: type II toxin-antitoxin system RelE/ParE family toxin [Betaproteobacteria bacterium]|nr:type II toxin-antitoxin system RelE/ParE family toxin [Betaproteobacteria bacterium]
MAGVSYSPRAASDLLRLVEFLADSDPLAAAETADLVASAVEALARHPLLGRPVESGYRELVISRGKTGYLALYRYAEARDRVLVLAIRHQREAGFI